MLTVYVEMAQTTPPVGINLHIIQGISKRPFSEVAIGICPFFVCQIILTLVRSLPLKGGVGEHSSG